VTTKYIGYILAEIAIAGALAVLLFFSLLFQPTWVWIVASAAILIAFVAITIYPRRLPGGAWTWILIPPLAFTLYLLVLGITVGLVSQPWIFFLVRAGYYVTAVILLRIHYLLNLWRGQSRRQQASKAL
jgi:hypothetical protein